MNKCLLLVLVFEIILFLMFLAAKYFEYHGVNKIDATFVMLIFAITWFVIYVKAYKIIERQGH
jgi:hypothetical protein